MLQEGVIPWTTQWREEGLAEGRAEGRAQILLHQLERKFGPLEESQRRKVREADADTLLEWSDRVLTATRWGDVVG